MHTLTLTLGGNNFGIPLGDVEHIEEKVNNIVKLPTASKYIKGMTTVRGVTVPIYNLALRFGYIEEKVKYLIIVNVDGMKLGLEADSVNGVIDIEKKEIFPLPIFFSGTNQYFIKDVALFHHKHLFVLIDVNRLIIQEEKEKIDDYLWELSLYGDTLLLHTISDAIMEIYQQETILYKTLQSQVQIEL